MEFLFLCVRFLCYRRLEFFFVVVVVVAAAAVDFFLPWKKISLFLFFLLFTSGFTRSDPLCMIVWYLRVSLD